MSEDMRVLGPEIGSGISNTLTIFFPWGPIISQIIIMLQQKKKKLTSPLGFKLEQPIWHFPETPDGQSDPGQMILEGGQGNNLKPTVA